jgi:hypothetical protein
MVTEYLSPFYAPDDDMVAAPRCVYPRFPWHGSSLARPWSKIKHKIMDVPLILPEDPFPPRYYPEIRAGSSSEAMSHLESQRAQLQAAQPISGYVSLSEPRVRDQTSKPVVQKAIRKKRFLMPGQQTPHPRFAR